MLYFVLKLFAYGTLTSEPLTCSIIYPLDIFRSQNCKFLYIHPNFGSLFKIQSKLFYAIIFRSKSQSLSYSTVESCLYSYRGKDAKEQF